ncbi:hydroxyethylthiazole kinase [Agrobacterium rhizogenes]|nr:hydroxyethylthiazole kinase [Rhizobium rhizogenes]NTG32206.1 hydroxyethylthiazole kinase [Rhizobium rhizogenes]
MATASWNDPSVKAELAKLKATGPFVYGVTNYIAANLSANILLAVGAGPAIGVAADWPESFAAGASSVWINAAGLMSSTPDRILAVAKSANAAGTPWVLDPVAIGAGAPLYDQFIRSLVEFKPTVIRGNASELIALAGAGAGGKGVETTASSADALPVLSHLATRTGAIIAVSGATDFITDGKDVIAVEGGDVRLTKLTGAGCSLGALIAAFLPSAESPLHATAAAHAIYAEAAERAGRTAHGTSSFGIGFVDELSRLDPAA